MSIVFRWTVERFKPDEATILVQKQLPRLKAEADKGKDVEIILSPTGESAVWEALRDTDEQTDAETWQEYRDNVAHGCVCRLERITPMWFALITER